MAYVYDKAKYHDGSVHELDLPEEQACVHTAFYLGWLIDNNLMSEVFNQETEGLIRRFKAREITSIDIYAQWDCCLVDDMLSEKGNAFSQFYFDFERGDYLADYGELLVRDLPTEFHVPFTWENYAIISARIDDRYTRWRSRRSHRWWQFWRR